jgi:Glycosyltransferase family 87/WD40-like Beta Propeller Repeat
LIVSKLRTSIEIFILSVLVAVFVWLGFVPAWRSLNTDFPSYYVAARLFGQGDSLTRVYDWIWFQRQKDRAGIENRIVPFSPLTLYSALPITPLTSFQPLSAKRWWLIINLFFLAFSAFALHRMTNLSRLRIAILMLLAIYPLQTHFRYGQLHILVLTLLVISLWLYLKQRPFGAGALIAAASAIKIYPIVFILYFVRKKQWRVVAGIAAGVIVLGVLAIYLFGLQVNRIYLEQLLPRIIRGEVIDPYNLRWNSFAAFIRRLFIFEPELNPKPLMNLPAAFAILLPLTQALLFVPLLWLISARRGTDENEKVEYGTFLAAVLLLSPTPASYHYVVLIITIVVAADFLFREKQIREATLLVVLYALSGFPIQSLGLFRLICTLGFFFVLLSVLGRRTSETWRDRLRSRSALVFVPVFLVMVCFGAFVTLRHVKSEMNDALRVGTGTLLATDAVVSEERIAFTTLQPRTYDIGILAENKLSSIAAGADLFHPTFIPRSSEALVELAGPNSRIIRIDLNERPESGRPFPVEVENAEQPVVSPDGRWLLFMREVRGRGSLWIKDREADTERELVTPEHDVLEAAFASDGAEIIFSAQPRGEPALFKTGRASSAITQVTFGSGSRYPAVSPDGRWMAYSRLHSGNWQIWVSRRDSDKERRLTTGECNSISPAWTPDSKELIYSTDCGRGVGLTALARLVVE